MIEFVSMEEHAKVLADLAFACHLGVLFIDKHDGIALTQEQLSTDTGDWKVEVAPVEGVAGGPPSRMYTINKGATDGKTTKS